MTTKGMTMTEQTPSGVPDTETTKDRIRRYGQLVESHPAADVPMPSLLVDEPEFTGFRAERKAIELAREREEQLWGEYLQRCEKARAAHQRAVERAAETGADFPDPYVEEVWKGRPLAPVYNHLDPTDRMPVNRPGIFWDEKLRGVDAHERAVLIEKRDELLARVERRKDLKAAQTRLEAAQRALDAAEDAWAPFGEAVKLLHHLGESRDERSERLKQERVARQAAETAEKAYRDVFAAAEEDGVASVSGPSMRTTDVMSTRSQEASHIERDLRERDRPSGRRMRRSR